MYKVDLKYFPSDLMYVIEIKEFNNEEYIKSYRKYIPRTFMCTLHIQEIMNVLQQSFPIVVFNHTFEEIRKLLLEIK